MNLYFTEVKKKESEIFKKEFPNAKFYEVELHKLSSAELKEVEVACIFIYSRIDKELIDKMKNLKAIVTRSSGYNHIDIDYCKQKGIKVYNVPDYGDETVAEFTVLLILAALRKMKRILYEVWFSRIINHEKLEGKDLQGKTVGIIGTGRIGSRVIKLLSSFDVEILAYDVYQKEELVKKYGVKYTSLEELLRNSDIVSIHVPLLPSTHHLINMKNIKEFKTGAYLINTSRGEVVENEALLYGLNEGILSGAALDVVESEQILLDEQDISKEQSYKNALINHILLKHDNVIITPHIAYNTEEALMRIIERSAEHIKKILKNESIDRMYEVV